MNYELLNKIAMEEAQRYKNEVSILSHRNEMLHQEIDKLRVKIKKLEEDRISMENDLESYKSALKFMEEKNKKDSFGYYS